ncbi:hypothetical protein EV193_10269 [Herbihabitans rhizosphaerae]|uniref:Uncharacterized protein n=1 Tax=Herbihabitans rhizosphaerae TaxID=1872711 RepID=A0A4V2EU25_9PSEU|nr:hypothetical protein [Herbihabitans rhizosphaerae]RZS43093.1 hypothetical protein EV193_10269 [Herbihabitans rhizosphaerae]
MSGADFDALYAKINAIVPGGLNTAAAAWRGFAKACQISAAKAGRAAGNVGGHSTAPYQAAADRANPIAGRVSGLAAQATAMAGRLATASEVAARAQYEAYQQKAQVDQAIRQAGAAADYHGDTNVQPNGAATASTNAGTRLAIENAKAAAAAKLRAEAAKVTAAYNAFGTSAPSESGGGGAGGGGAGGGGAAGGGAAGGGASASGGPAPASSAVAGPEAGDFAGWVRDPRTGHLVDPASGQAFDPGSGRYIDPLTGKPFGEVAQYASRLEGLSAGAPATSAGGIAPLATAGTGSAPVYGGVIPPSLSPTNPAAAQLQQRAAQQLAANAAAARQYAAASGHPYPPPAGGGYAGAAPSGTRSRGRSPQNSAPPSIWGGHPSSTRSTRERKQTEESASHWATDNEMWSSGQQIRDDLLDDKG